jgi:tRNA threonylcarbamoyladenosine biosynthesis protein TsaB
MEPLILALDTSHMKGSVSVSRGPDPVCEILFDASDTHSATLMPAVDDCLRNSRVRIEDVERFVIVIGPGSFTGLRIGLATVKGFAALRRMPVVPVVSLETLAAALPFARVPIVPLIDARRDEVYMAVYDQSGGMAEERVEPSAVHPDNIPRILEERGIGGPVITCGTGAWRYREQLKGILPEGSSIAPRRWSVPSASVATHLSLDCDPVPFDELPRLQPLYIRPPDAKLPAGAKLRGGGGE